MGKPLFSQEEIAKFRESINSIKDDPTLKDWTERNQAESVIHSAFLAQTVERIRNGRMEELAHYITILVGSKGARANVRLFQAFSQSDSDTYQKLLQTYNTALNRRYAHMFLKAVLVAPRSWATTALVKFLRGNKVAGGKNNTLEGFGDFHKDSGWIEVEVKRVATLLFDDKSHVAKLFLEYDNNLINDESIPYKSRFAAVNKSVDTAFIEELILILEKEGLAPKPAISKKLPKLRVAKEFKPNDIITSQTIQDLPELSHIEINVSYRNNDREPLEPGTVTIVLVTQPKRGEYLDIWRVVGSKAYLPARDRTFDRGRTILIGAKYLGQWEHGVQAQKKEGYTYPHHYIGSLVK